MEKVKFEYIRVSSRNQNEDCQLQSMEEVGISPRDIFVDKQSGKNFNREKYQLMKFMIRKRDILYIHSLDHLGCNKEEISQ